MLVVGGASVEPRASTSEVRPSPAAGREATALPTAHVSETSSDAATVGSQLTRVLNEDLVGFIEQAGFRPLGGDHDWMNASNTVEAQGDAVVSVFVHPVERANLGDVTFEQTSTAQVDRITVEFGRRSDQQAAARFNCGGFQFQFFDKDAAAVTDVATAVAAEVTCPYEPTT